MKGVSPLAPTTIPQLDGAEPDFESELEKERYYDAIQFVKDREKEFNTKILK